MSTATAIAAIAIIFGILETAAPHDMARLPAWVIALIALCAFSMTTRPYEQ